MPRQAEIYERLAAAELDPELSWSESDLPERERTKHVHRLHPYLGKYVPQLVEIFLRRHFRPGDTVLDPFLGTGTTTLAAMQNGRNSIGYEIDAHYLSHARRRIQNSSDFFSTSKVDIHGQA